MVRKLWMVLLAACVAAPAFADDLFPPPWDRGGPETTFQAWEFFDDNLNPFPDQLDNPYGMPDLIVNPFGDGWHPTLPDSAMLPPVGQGELPPIYQGTGNGVWGLSGAIDVHIPNSPYDPNREKWIWIQITWLPMFPQTDPLSSVPTVSAPDWGVSTSVPEIDGPNLESWSVSAYLIQLPENPDHEWIHISGDIWIDELVIDTICIPAPGMLAILGVAGLFVRRRRR